MHEMSIAESIVEIVQQHLPKGEDCKVRSITLHIGELAGVVPDSLEFCFSAITSASPLEGAQLVIERVPLAATCKSCGTTSQISIASFQCPACNSPDISVISGTELQVTEIETLDEAVKPNGRHYH
jgi:hydrogenase nickel incorporation protein HypA/HybF